MRTKLPFDQSRVQIGGRDAVMCARTPGQRIKAEVISIYNSPWRPYRLFDVRLRDGHFLPARWARTPTPEDVGGGGGGEWGSIGRWGVVFSINTRVNV